MPVFRVQVNYRIGLESKWSNVWHVSASDIVAALVGFNSAGVPNLLPLLHNDAEIASFLVSDLAGAQFITQPVNAAGTSADSGDRLALFNSVKVNLIDGSLGRPDYKFLKGFLTEGSQTDGELTSGTRTAVQTGIASLITDMDTAGTPLVSADNDQYSSNVVQAAVQMRQMHRRRKKAVTP